MAKKPTYEELEQRVKKLEEEAVKDKRTDEALEANEQLKQEIVERKQTEEQLRTMHCAIESSISGIAITDIDSNLTYVNPHFLKMWGYDDDKEILGRPGIEFWQMKEEATKALQTLQEKGVWVGELSAKRKDGTVFHAQVSASTMTDKEDSPKGIIVSFVDITDRKQAEEALRESEKRFRSMFEHMGSGAAVYEAAENGEDFIFRDFNPSAERITRISRNAVLGNRLLDLFPHMDRSGFLGALQRVWKTGRAEHLPPFYYKDEAREGWRENRIYKLPTGEVVALFDDVTERKRTEEALRKSEERFRTIFDYAGDGMAIHDLDGHFFEVNQQFCDQLGYSRDELLQMRPQDVDAPEQAVRVPGRISNILEQGHEVFETEHVRRDGSIIPVEINARLLDISGKPAILATIRDLAERKQAEEEKKVLEAKFQQAQKMEAIGTLAGGIAHDFNNLLMGIQGHSSLLMLHIDSDHPHFERLKGIQDMVQTGANLTKQLLGFARGGKYEVKPTDLNEIVNQSCEMFGRTQKDIEINRKHQKGIWPVEVDRGQIHQVLLNLYVNAWQAMSGGGYIYIETSNVMLDENDTKPFNVKLGKYVKISVTDTGAGMDKTTQQKIFDPFFTTKEMGRGTGLGLASAHGIIKHHSGIINVYSEKGKGATFNIYLPASEKKISITKKSRTDEIPKGTETVLLVDDEEIILDVGKDMLTEIGYKVLLAKSGKEAVEVYRKHKDTIDLVIVDLIMPGEGGGEVYDRIKEINPDVKVLLSSGYSIDSQAKEILARGCDAFIQKPFGMQELSQRIREILEKGV